MAGDRGEKENTPVNSVTSSREILCLKTQEEVEQIIIA
jgi:hypothetical protein